MNRLLQGEVGSGKTVVALRAMLQVVDAGRQAVLLAPTEGLAAQHARSLREMLGPHGCAGELGSAEHATRIAEDTVGSGHSWRLTDDQPWRRAYVILAPGVPVPFQANRSKHLSPAMGED